MAHGNVTDEELAEAAKAYIRGDMRTYFTLIRHGGMNVNPKWLHRDDRKWPHLAS
jgi:hypothetical protein